MFSVTQDSRASSKQKHHQWDPHSCTIWALWKDFKSCRCPYRSLLGKQWRRQLFNINTGPRHSLLGSFGWGIRPYHPVLQTREVAVAHLWLTGALDRTEKPPWARTGQRGRKLLQHLPYWLCTGTKSHVPFWGVLVFFLPSYAKKFPCLTGLAKHLSQFWQSCIKID